MTISKDEEIDLDQIISEFIQHDINDKKENIDLTVERVKIIKSDNDSC